jgi:hypothetical protein
VDFHYVVEPKTYFNARSEKDSNKNLYVVRINVKPGNPYELYHLINEKNVPEFYIRKADML